MNKYNVLVQYAYENEILNKTHRLSEPYGSIIPDHIQLGKTFEVKTNLDLNVGMYAKKYSNGVFEPFEMIKAVEYAIKRRNSSVPYIDIVERHESKESPTSKSIEILGYKMRISKLEKDIKDKDNLIEALKSTNLFCSNCTFDYCGCSVQDSILQVDPTATFNFFGCVSHELKILK